MMYYLKYKSIFSSSHKFCKYFTLENTKELFRRTQICCSSGLQKISFPKEGFKSYRNGIIHFYFICNACCNFVDEDAFTYLQVLLLPVLPLLIFHQILLTTSTLPPDRLSHLNLNSSDKSLPQDNPISKNLISHKNNSASRTRIEGLMVDCEEQEGGGEVEGGGGDLVNSDLSSYSVHYNYVKARYMKCKA